MDFNALSFSDQIDIRDALGHCLGGLALGPNGQGNPLAARPLEDADEHAALVYEQGWATKTDGQWTIDFDAYLNHRADLMQKP